MKVLNELALELLDDLNIDPNQYFDVAKAVGHATVRDGCGPDILWLAEPTERLGALVQEVLKHNTGECRYAFDKTKDVHGYRASVDGFPGLVGANVWRDADGKVHYRIVRDLSWKDGGRMLSIIKRPHNLPVQALLSVVEGWCDKRYAVEDCADELSSFSLRRASKDRWIGAVDVAPSRRSVYAKRPALVDLYLMKDLEDGVRVFAKLYNR